MRSGLIFILTICVYTTSFGQSEWSDAAHYSAYIEGNWKKVVELGKLAKKSGADYYYIRARNGYANYQLGKYFRAEKEFEKALKFNAADPFAKRYGYWSSVYAGNTETALVKGTRFTDTEKDTIKSIRPKWISGISVIGGYRTSTSQNVVGNMPYVAMYLSHQIGSRITLRHGVNYLNQTRTSLLTRLNSEVWQVGYLASLGIQVAEHTTISPSFIMQYWQTEGFKVYDLSATVAVRQQFGNVSATLIGGYFQDTDTNRYMVGASLTWYPLQSPKFYSITSGGYNFMGEAPNPFLTQTLGGNIIRGLWFRSSFTLNNQVVSFEDIGLDFANNSSDRLRWRWGVTPSYYILENLGISLTYTIESRLFYLPEIQIGPVLTQARSDRYNFHSFYLGLNYKF